MRTTQKVQAASLLYSGQRKGEERALPIYTLPVCSKETEETVALIRKNLTPRLLAGNRANSRKSTGPRTELGKRHASRNSGKHLVYAGVSPATMKELGEDPAEFQKLRESFFKDFQPQGGFEKTLVEDMARLRWRILRMQRAESGILASKKREFELDREWHVASTGRGAQGEVQLLLAKSYGLSGIQDSPANYRRVLDDLRLLRDQVKTEGFRKEGLQILEMIYGSSGGVEGFFLKAHFKAYLELQEKQEQIEDEEAQRMRRMMFLARLDSEISSFEKLCQLALERNVNPTDSMKDAQLLPSQEDLEKIMRYETHLERQFERKLQQLVSWRRLDREGTIEKSVGVGASVDERD